MYNFSTFLKESEALKKYLTTDNFMVYKGEVRREYQELNAKYPFGGGVLYRGLNFTSPKEYLQFRRSIKDGYITSSNISSWTTNIRVGSQYAKSPQVFQFNAQVASIWDSAERVMGFVGIIVAIRVPSNTGIDTRKSPYSSEEEIILPPGTYKIERLHVEKKWKHIVNKLDINDEIVLMMDRPIDHDRVRSLFRYKGDQLYDSVKAKLVSQGIDSISKNFKVYVKETKDSYRSYPKEFDLLFPDGEITFRVNAFIGIIDYLKEEDIQKFITHEQKNVLGKVIVQSVDKEMFKYKNKKVLVTYQDASLFRFIYQLFGLTMSDFKYLSKNYSDMYNRFNNELGREYNKKHHFDMYNMTKVFTEALNNPFKH